MLGLGLTIGLLSGCAVDPITGNEQLMLYPPDKDVQLGRQYSPLVEKQLGGRMPEEGIQSYVNEVGQRIARVCHRPDLEYHFAALEEGGANALALPGGYVYITRDLLKELKSEAQLAAVLGHELTHVVARHTVAAMSRQIGMTALLGVAIAGSATGSVRGDVPAATGFVSSLLSLQYSREDESEADLAGLSYMAQAGYDPNSMVETMQILEKLQTIRPVEFFSTHPNPESRITYLEDKITTRYSSLGGLKKGQEEYSQRVLAPLHERKRRFNVPPADAAQPEASPSKTSGSNDGPARGAASEPPGEE